MVKTKKQPVKKAPVKKQPVKKQEEFTEEELVQDIKDTLEVNEDDLLEIEQEYEDSVFHTPSTPLEDKTYDSLEDQLKQHAESQDPNANPVITEPDAKTLEQLEMLKEVEQKEKVASSKGQVIHYPAQTTSQVKESVENIRNQIINTLMSKHGFSFVEARAELEMRLKNSTLEIIRTEAAEGKIIKIKSPQSSQPSGVQIQQMKGNIKHY